MSNYRIPDSLIYHLHCCLRASIADFKHMPNNREIANRDGQLLFIPSPNPNAKVLAVGHLDMVMQSKFNQYGITNDGLIYNCPQLDDRLGVWVICFLIPAICQFNQLDFDYDILLTDCEEAGNSTAQHFQPDKEYNWIFEFDRAGLDCALYDYMFGDDGTDWEDEIERFSLERCQYGAFTDICELEHLGCKAVNIGVGYHDQHTAGCFADLNDTFTSVKAFLKWAVNRQHTLFPHTERSYRSRWNSFSYLSKRADNRESTTDWQKYLANDNKRACDICGQATDQFKLCDDCQDYMVSVYEKGIVC